MLRIISIIMLLCCVNCYAKELTIDDINKLMNQDYKNIDINNKHMDKALKQAEDALNKSNLTQRLQTEKQRLEKVFLKENVLSDTDIQKAKDKKDKQGRVYLFISKSVPLDTLRNYAKTIEDMKDKEVTMVLRGFVGGMAKIMPTVEFIQSIIKKDSSCDFGQEKCPVYTVNINVDPMLFRQYGIIEVPSIVCVKDNGEWDKVSGDLGLEEMMEKMSQ